MTTLEEAARFEPQDARILNDLAAAYLTRDDAHDGSDAFRAVEMVERAWRLRQTPEIAWNRALASERIHLRATALTAWIDFLNIETDPEWRAEGVTHILRLSAPSRSRQWNHWRQTVANPAAYRVAARAFPQELRMYGEEEILAAWATATIAGDPRAEASLQEAERIGQALQDAGGDEILAGTIQAIHAASDDRVRLRRLAAAHVLYKGGRAHYARQEMTQGIAELDEAAKQLAAEQSPFSLRAALYAAATEYYAARHKAALARLERIRDTLKDAPARYPSLAGQVHWVMGLVELSRGHRNEALAAFHTALEAFDRSGEAESRAGIESLLAETYRGIGQSNAEGTYQRRALNSLEILGPTRQSHAILTAAAMAAAQEGAPFTALLFQQNVVTGARLSRDPVSIADAVIGRSAYAAAAGERGLAEADLAEAARGIRDVSDPVMRDRCLANFLAAEATVTRTFDPQRTARVAAQAITRMGRLGHRVRLVQLHLEAGRAFDQTARPEEALRQWHEGIDECERQRTGLGGDEYRRTYFDTCRSLFEESIGALIRANRSREALRLAEESRARGLFDALSPHASVGSPVPLPQGVTVVEYSVLPDRLVTWVVADGLVHSTVRMVDRTVLRREIDRLASTRSDEAAFRSSSARLYDLLVAPIRTLLSPRVIFIPDDRLYRVAFAALLDRRTKLFLVQQHEVSVGPSMALLTLRTERRGSSSQKTVLIDAGSVMNRYRPETVRLPATNLEIRQLRALYPGATVLEGAECTNENVARSIQSASVVHFAGHAVDGRSATDPALVLFPVGADHGLLYPREISRLPLAQAHLIVLGACATADGRIGSEGALSIARAFLAAGAHRVLATLWEIDDERSSHLLVSFHRGTHGNTRPEQALRQIQIQAIREDVPAFEWAAFEVLHASLE
ncbi:MAG: CHAT domain-containing protein [Acidobacteriota bacterium]